MSMQEVIQKYLTEVQKQLDSGQATEHSYRPALKELLNALNETIEAINEPKQSEHGAPDFIVIGKKNKDLKLGYGEAKIPGESLDKIEKSEQMNRYKGYANLFLTDCFDWRFFRNGEKIFEIKIGELTREKKAIVSLDPTTYPILAQEISNFLTQTPEKIRSGKRLAEIMGGKARRIRDNILLRESISADVENIYDMMKKLLVHDLTHEKFADMYAQTLVYGLFVARYMDASKENFSRQEARDLVPKSNPFLRHFFDHIVGPDFDASLGYIVDELCEVFSVSDVAGIVHKHLKVSDESTGTKDPIIHFYEDFLKEYDPSLRKQMGAYYTPVPVVRYIIRQVDKILKEDFHIVDGLASTETITREVETQPWRMPGERKDRLTKPVDMPRVQILDPAVGTATFLNETIKYIHESFKGQEGRWPSYAEQNLVPRLFGFELMMAPYTIAHLKLGMTLKETGVSNLADRLNVYLTNTLEEGTPPQLGFNFGLAEAVSEESRLAADVKTEKPVMIVMGNPPYSVSSNNKSKYIDSLVAGYKKDLNERNIQPLSDDYIKFIRFAENMIEKNGSGIVAMITNNSYIDGLIHRQMRKHLLQTFDKIYVLDLHGNSKKKEAAPDGSKDENVFDIQQGVAIILAVKSDQKQFGLGKIYHSEIFGVRRYKFDELNKNILDFEEVDVVAPDYYLLKKDMKMRVEYEKFISIRELMPLGDAGIKTHRDAFVIDFDRNALEERIRSFYNMSRDDLVSKYGIKDGRDFSIGQSKLSSKFDESLFRKINYRPFDVRWCYYSKWLMDWPRNNTMRHFAQSNLGLVMLRNFNSLNEFTALATDKLTEKASIPASNYYIFPLYIYHDDGTRTPNFDTTQLTSLFRNMPYTIEDLNDGAIAAHYPDSISPESILDYIYAVLHSPSYREKYKEFLKIDFPRVPAPRDAIEFWNLVKLGKELRLLHLMKSPVIANYDTIYPVAGDDVVEKTSYLYGKVYINNTQHFGKVPEIAWNFYIGGYQPAQKWLKDRKGRKLSSDDIDHYQKIIKILTETDRIMKEIS